MIELCDATFRLNDRLIFQGTSWHFRRGEQWAVAGGNGSGKSLFLEAIRGRLPLVEGELDYRFRPPKGLSHEEALAHLAFEEDPALHGAVLQARWNSIEEEGAINVAEFLAYNKIMEVSAYEVTTRHEAARRSFERRLATAIRLLEIGRLLSRRVISLSSGERKKVRIAGALARPSRLLLLDEPFTGLDASSRRHFSQTLQSLIGHGMHLLVATTRPEDLPAGFNQVLELQDLRVVRTRSLGPRRARESSRPFPPSRRPASSTSVPGEVLVRLSAVSVRYGETTIFDRLSWTIRKGERWALLGPNGSGKSTLIGLITGDHPQVNSNDVRLFGKQPGHGCSVWELKQRVGMVSPEMHLFFPGEVPCADVVASGFFDSTGLYEEPQPAQKRQAHKWLRRLGLARFASEPFSALSLGEQRLVLLARAMVKEPCLLLLDEPCQGLDEPHRRLILQLVDSRTFARSALVYVTHRDDELPRSVSHVFRLPL